MNGFFPFLLAQADLAGETFNYKDFLLDKGGVVMIPLIFLSVVAAFLIIYYLLTLRKGAVVSDRFMNTAESLIRQRDMAGLLGYCERHDKSISRITERTMDFITKNQTASLDEVREVTQTEGARQASVLNQKISYLADIGAIAPMVGLLGTVIGMIKAFSGIGAGLTPDVLQNRLAADVSEALITTASGLVIAITCLAFHSFFRGRVQRYISDLEAAATHILAVISTEFSVPQPKQTPPLSSEPLITQSQSTRSDLQGI